MVSATLSTKVTGSVYFQDPTGAPLCTATVIGKVAKCTIDSTLLNAGKYFISASYSADATHAAAAHNQWLTVKQAVSTLKIATNLKQVASDRLDTLVVSALLGSHVGLVPPGPVTLSIDGVRISSDAATFSFATWRPSKSLSKGSHTLTATYAGSTNYTAVSSSCKFVTQ
jgi:hypothetical protein